MQWLVSMYVCCVSMCICATCYQYVCLGGGAVAVSVVGAGGDGGCGCSVSKATKMFCVVSIVA